MRPILVLGLLVTVVFAGCLGGGDTMTAKEGLKEARSTAKDWVDDPQLIGVMSIEPFHRLYEEDEHEVILHLDGTPGDGKAPGWVYLFKGTDRFVFIVVAAGLGVLAEGWESDEDWGEKSTDAFAVTGWAVDSDEAAKALAQHPDWPEIGEEWTVAWELAMEPEEDTSAPYWSVVAENETEMWEAVVHAGNGTVMWVEEWEWDEWKMEPIEPGSWGASDRDADRGIVSSVTGEIQVTVTLSGIGQIDADASGLLAGGSIEVELAGPSGIIDTSIIDAASWGAGFGVETDEVGTYTLTVRPLDTTTAGEADLFIEAYW